MLANAMTALPVLLATSSVGICSRGAERDEMGDSASAVARQIYKVY